MPPLLNLTIPLPPGSTTHSTPGLLCTPTTALDLLTFYLLNYIAHAATVLTRPGERASDYAAAVVGALLFPALGLYRGIDAVLSGAVWVRNDELRRAARSGALCFVVRGGEWRPDGEGEVDGVVYRRAVGGGAAGNDALGARPQVEEGEIEDGGEGEKSRITRRSLTGSTLTTTTTTSSSSSASTTPNPQKNKHADADETKGRHTTHILPFSPPWISTRFGHPIFAHRHLIHGTHVLPPGYRFAILPPNAALAPITPSPSPLPTSTTSPPTTSTITTTNTTTPASTTPSTPPPTLSLSAQTSTLKALIALLQSSYALSTLYRARGNQIQQFGFAAFGLTVAPYAVMSIMNLLGNICRPEYPSLYMVGGSVMEEARRRGGVFEGVVARVVEGGGRCGWGGGEGGEEVGRVRFGWAGRGRLVEGEKEKEEKKEEDKVEQTESEGTHEQEHDEEDHITAYFAATNPRASSPSTLIPCTATIAPLPKKLNYINTDHAALLLIPSHPPFQLTTTSTPSTSTPPPRPSLKSLKLARTNPFCAHQTWTSTFTRTPSTNLARHWRWTKYLLLITISLLPLTITGVMSGFQRGTIPWSESSNWLVFTGQWLACGVLTGLWWVVDQEGKEALPSVREQVGPVLRCWLYLSSASPAVGGFVVVGQMLYRYGSCVWVGD